MYNFALILATLSHDIDLVTTVVVLEENTPKGMQAVFDVIHTRAKGSPRNYKKVVLRKWQFSCINEHTVNKLPLRTLINKAKRRSNWDTAEAIVRKAYKRGKGVVKRNSPTHYHVYKNPGKVTPYWTHPSLGGKNEKAIIVKFVGNHCYLRNVD
jgi:hypothetical protein